MKTDNFAARLRKSIENKGLTQSEVGKACGWQDSQSRIANYVNGISQPRLADLERLAEVLDVSVQWLLTGEDIRMNKEEQEMLTLFRELSPEQRRLFRDLGANLRHRSDAAV